MDFMQRLQDGLNKGLNVSRDLFGKAKDKAQELGEKGVLKVEIMQLEDQAAKLMGKLGALAFESFCEGRDSMERSAEVDALVREIEDVKGLVEAKERQLKMGF